MKNNQTIKRPFYNLMKNILPNMDAELLRQFFDGVLSDYPIHKRTWHKGSYLFQQNKPFDSFVLIDTGLVRCFYTEHFEHVSQEINLRFLGDNSASLPFDAVAKHWLIANQPSDNQKMIATEDIQCVTDVTGFQLPLALFEQNNILSQILKTELALRHYLSIEQRLRMLKIPKASDRYACFKQTLDACIVNNMPNYHVASYLSMTPETLSRLKRMEAQQ